MVSIVSVRSGHIRKQAKPSPSTCSSDVLQTCDARLSPRARWEATIGGPRPHSPPTAAAARAPGSAQLRLARSPSRLADSVCLIDQAERRRLACTARSGFLFHRSHPLSTVRDQPPGPRSIFCSCSGSFVTAGLLRRRLGNHGRSWKRCRLPRLLVHLIPFHKGLALPLGQWVQHHLRNIGTRVRDIAAKRLRQLLPVVGEDLRILRSA